MDIPPKRARLFVISAPSGSGKTTLCKKLLGDKLGLGHSVSVTTRPPRKGEKPGADYRFVSKKIFEELIKKREFLEYEENFGYLYGTPGKAIEKNIRKGKSVLLSIDVKGAMRVRKAYPKDSVLIFILPPSVKALKERLISRMSDDEEEIARRLKLARREMAYKDKYDYCIINDRLNSAYKKLKEIIMREGSNAGHAHR